MPDSKIAMSVAAIALCLCAGLQAQTIYRIVGPDGKVTFTDKPPSSPEQGTVASLGVGAAATATNASLPFELRNVASKFPVTFYSTADCQPCGAGRGLLTARGIPFTEKTVSSPEDIAALQRLSGQTALPFLTIGGQKISGFSSEEWSQTLDAAGYPAVSQLPPSYRQAMPTPLVGLQRPTPTPEVRPASPTSPLPDSTSAGNPAGIKF
jgi:glutaredoxin